MQQIATQHQIAQNERQRRDFVMEVWQHGIDDNMFELHGEIVVSVQHFHDDTFLMHVSNERHIVFMEVSPRHEGMKALHYTFGAFIGRYEDNAATEYTRHLSLVELSERLTKSDMAMVQLMHNTLGVLRSAFL